MKTINHIGKMAGVFNIVERMSYKDSAGRTLYRGICRECGFERIARYSDLNETTKCKHIGIDGRTVKYNIGWTNKRIQKIFYNMKDRCYNKNNKTYRWYGAKGIKICDEWLNNPKLFEEWALQNGYTNELTIDRIDENKDYSPDNCRWITNVENTKYKSTTSMIGVDGEIHSGRDWSEILGLGTNTINTYVRQYGLDNTIEFIRRYLKNPNLRLSINRGESIYDLYMNSTNKIIV